MEQANRGEATPNSLAYPSSHRRRLQLRSQSRMSPWWRASRCLRYIPLTMSRTLIVLELDSSSSSCSKPYRKVKYPLELSSLDRSPAPVVYVPG